MATDELLIPGLDEEPDKSLDPFDFAYSRFERDLAGKLIRVTYQETGQPQPRKEDVIFLSIEGRQGGILKFQHPENKGSSGLDFLLFAGTGGGISEISLVDVEDASQAVVYKNPSVTTYYKACPDPLGNTWRLFIRGRWFPQAIPTTGK
jgi:hypothetical protein